MSDIISLSENIFLQKHPLSLAGCQLGRNVTVIRFTNGQLLIHSTADFSTEDLHSIRKLGKPAWLFEATLYHDTFAEKGRKAFPNVPYFVPSGFPNTDALQAQEISSKTKPNEWIDELDLIAIRGVPKLNEYALYHSSSKTLILADLIFNLPPTVRGWTRFFIRIMSGIKQYPGMSRLLKFCIKDREAFIESLREIAALDFDHIIVAHGDPITTDAKSHFLEAINKAGFNL